MPLKKLTIVAYRDDTFNDAVETFTVMINPDEYSYDHAIEHTRVTGQGAAGEVRQFSYVRAARIRQLRRDAGAHAQVRLAQREFEFDSRPGCDSDSLP